MDDRPSYCDPVISRKDPTMVDTDTYRWKYEGFAWNRVDGKWKPPDTELKRQSASRVKESMTTATHISMIRKLRYLTKAQSDSGANRIVTDDITKLTNVVEIEPYPMGGCSKDEEVAIVCTAKGDMNLITEDGSFIKVQAYYSKQVDGTIISPTTIVRQNIDKYTGWIQYADVRNNKGTIVLTGEPGVEDVRLPVTSINDLWYHEQSPMDKTSKATVRKLNAAAEYELWHQRTGHAGTTCLHNLHKHAKGVPKLRGNAFYRCPICMADKLCTKVPIGKTKEKKLQRQMQRAGTDTNVVSEIMDDYLEGKSIKGEPGQHMHMDFGFVRGSDFKDEDKEGNTITSIDGKNSYLLIIDRSTRFIWIFLTSSKVPPIEAARMVLEKFKSDNPNRTVRVDQGGELGKSEAFQDMVGKANFTLETTGSEASAQNGMAERPNRTFGHMMRCLLHNAELGPEFWSYALMHAVYIKNRIPHASIKMSPYEAMTGITPDLSALRIFGCRIYAKKTGKRPAKLDGHTASGIFLGYTATMKNCRYIDDKTGQIKIATHAIFDEAQMTSKPQETPISAQTLQRLGYSSSSDMSQRHQQLEATEENNPTFKVQILKTDVALPTRGTPNAIGYDITSSHDEPITIPPKSMKVISTGIAITTPPGCYARIAPRSGLTVKKQLTTMAGVVDPDYTGEVKVVMWNFGDEEQSICRDDKIAQIILERALTVPVENVAELIDTHRGDSGFGSTDKTKEPNLQQVPSTKPTPPTISPSTAVAASMIADINMSYDLPYKINLSSKPYDALTHRMISVRPSDDETLGMVLEMCPSRKLPRLKDCKKGQSAIKIKCWRSQLRESYITHINDISVKTVDDIKHYIRTHRILQPRSDIKVNFATIEKQAMHPQYGIPQMYHDQLHLIGKDLFELKNNVEWQRRVNESIVYPEDKATLAKLNKIYQWQVNNSEVASSVKVYKLKKQPKLTRRTLQERDDWDEWKASEFKQLDQYRDQETFGKPCPLPKGANLLPLLWTYLIKDDGTKKARCVCNGSKRMQGTVTLAHTYAASLDQTGARIFWAASAINNFVTIGADASNAFAEAPAPKAPLYVSADRPYREWYKARYPEAPPLPKNHVLPVQGALQGHPESPRLWSKLIDKIIQQLNLQPCTQEKNLYYTNNYNNQGKTVLLLRQVDDFAVACEDEATASTVISDINSKMTIDVKKLGRISRFNGMDILQTRRYVKLFNETYINKILLRHPWLFQEQKVTVESPMHDTPAHMHKLESAVPEENLSALENEMGFGYRQAIGELIYALTTCRPDISFAVIKLSQYSAAPSRVHFDAVKQVYRYLNQTKKDGIHYWRKTPRDDLPDLPDPILQTGNNEPDLKYLHTNEVTMDGAVDSDYASDTTHRRSVSGIILRIVGGTIFYKTRFQPTIAASSTEAEFTAAAEAGKYILYVRSILEEINIPQTEATVLYEDNQGALLMANAQQPTKNSRHMDIKTFMLQQWVEEDTIILERIDTQDNFADAMTKATGKSLYNRHMNYILGKHRPSYVTYT